MKIKQTNLGLIIEKSQAVQSVIDSYTKLEELKPEGVSRRILDLQRVNINPNNVRRLIFSENVFNQIAKVKVGEDSIAFIYEPLACHSYNTIKYKNIIHSNLINIYVNFYRHINQNLIKQFNKNKNLFNIKIKCH
jgi:hypothetical protein